MTSGTRWRSGCLPAGAILASPFLALYAGLDAGLFVAAAALAVVAWLGFDGSRDLDPVRRGRLRVFVAVDLLFAAICVAVIVIRHIA